MPDSSLSSSPKRTPATSSTSSMTSSTSLRAPFAPLLTPSARHGHLTNVPPRSGTIIRYYHGDIMRVDVAPNGDVVNVEQMDLNVQMRGVPGELRSGFIQKISESEMRGNLKSGDPKEGSKVQLGRSKLYISESSGSEGKGRDSWLHFSEEAQKQEQIQREHKPTTEREVFEDIPLEGEVGVLTLKKKKEQVEVPAVDNRKKTKRVSRVREPILKDSDVERVMLEAERDVERAEEMVEEMVDGVVRFVKGLVGWGMRGGGGVTGNGG